MAAFIANSGGVLRELHLSHNELDAAGAAEVILATVSARDERGEFVYPKIWDGQPVPLWLRLEQNYVDHSELIKLLLPNFARIGRRSTVMCRMTDKGCTPGCCVRGTPAIHINHLKLQRVRAEPVREARGCETEASEVARQSMRTAATQTQTTSCGTLTACHSINPSHGHSGAQPSLPRTAVLKLRRCGKEPGSQVLLFTTHRACNVVVTATLVMELSASRCPPVRMRAWGRGSLVVHLSAQCSGRVSF